MIIYHTDKKVDFQKLIKLFNQVSWDGKIHDTKRLNAMVNNS